MINGGAISMGVDLFSVVLGAEMNGGGRFRTVDDSFSRTSLNPVQNKVISQAIMIEDETSGKFYVPMLKIVNSKPQLHLEEFTEV